MLINGALSHGGNTVCQFDYKCSSSLKLGSLMPMKACSLQKSILQQLPDYSVSLKWWTWKSFHRKGIGFINICTCDT